MTLSLRFSDEDAMLIRKYAEMNGMTMSDVIRSSVIDRIEDEFDLKLYEKALSSFKADPVTYTLDEVESELGLK